MSQILTDSLNATYNVVTCAFVETAFTNAQPDCKTSIDSLKLLFVGTMLISISFFAMWVTFLGVASRLLNMDRMIDVNLPKKYARKGENAV